MAEDPPSPRDRSLGNRPPAASALPIGLTVVLLLGAFGIVALAAPGQSVPAAGSSVFLNVSTTETVLFAPDTLSVQPGQAVHLVVTQLADFNHTFVLSPVANFTFPTTDTTADLDAFFAAHPPLVNLSLAPTMGTKYYANFTAPPIGNYEYVCLVSGHFASGMHGELASGTSGTGSGSAAPTALYALIAVVVVIVVALVGVMWVRSRRRRAPPSS